MIFWRSVSGVISYVVFSCRSSAYHRDLHLRKYNYKIGKIIQPAQKP